MILRLLIFIVAYVASEKWSGICLTGLTDCSNPAQGWRKLFITGQAKLDPEHYSIKCVGG